MNKKINLSLRNGFTIIELLVVIAIIGILAAVVMVSLNSAREKAKVARVQSDVRNLMSAVEMYKNDNNDTVPTVNDMITAELISSAPQNPFTNAAYVVTDLGSGSYRICGAIKAPAGAEDYFYAKDGSTGTGSAGGCP